MTYTTQQLQAMSDFEVNKGLAHKLGMKTIPDGACNESEVYCGFDQYGWAYRDYCNNPNDIMPLAFERRIGISTYLKSDDWMAFMCDNSGKSFIDTNPLRAIACLLLMMED